MGVNGPAARRRARWFLVMALTGAAMVALVACGGGGSKDGGSSPVPGSPTPHPQPTIDGSTFNFPARGYAVTIPPGWHANPNSLLAGPQQVDTFFSDDTVEGVQSNIAITCEANPANVSTQQFFQNKLTTLGTLGARDVQQLGSTTVGGVEAQEVAYNLARGDVKIAKVDVMLVTPACAWTIASASAPSLVNQNGTIFQEFLKSFKLVSAENAGA
jgi:hypothetical protein